MRRVIARLKESVQGRHQTNDCSSLEETQGCRDSGCVHTSLASTIMSNYYPSNLDGVDVYSLCVVKTQEGNAIPLGIESNITTHLSRHTNERP